jgi:hypothetical protein
MKKLFFFLALATGFASANAQLSVTITGSTTGVPLSASAVAATPYNGFGVSCNLAATNNGTSTNTNGSITGTVTGGSTTFTYDLYAGATATGTAAQTNSAVSGTTSSFSGLLGSNAGTPYTLKVTDINGCTATATTVTVTAPTTLTASISQTLTDLCQVNGGSATVTPLGGVPTYTFAYVSSAAISPFSGTPATPVIATPTVAAAGTSTATGLTGNASYVFSITDANGCKL